MNKQLWYIVDAEARTIALCCLATQCLVATHVFSEMTHMKGLYLALARCQHIGTAQVYDLGIDNIIKDVH